MYEGPNAQVTASGVAAPQQSCPIRLIARPSKAAHRYDPLRLGIIGAALIAVLCGLVTRSEAYIEHPWCTSGRGWAGGTSCAFDTYEHCLENARLYTANCVANPAIDPLPQAGSRAARPRGR
jgi:hypothetical protein